MKNYFNWIRKGEINIILDSIKIENIRSIKQLELKFPSSTMLFFGDIGSGKSSVLKAIEFALFGTLNAADLSGDSLLRRGENKGTVELSFIIDNTKYLIKRGLRKSKKKDRESVVSQDKGFLKIYQSDGVEELSLAATDLRRNILEILKYSITRYERAHKIPLFRYTVYTPQEEIKEIILAKAENRFEILKEVFGIEKYEIALRNIDIIKDYLKDGLKEIKIYLESLGDPEAFIPEKELEIEDQKQIIEIKQKDLRLKQEEVKKENSSLDSLQSGLNKYSKNIAEISSKQSIIKDTLDSIESNKKTIENILKEIEEKNGELGDLPILELDVHLKEGQLERKIEETNDIILRDEKNKNLLEDKINNIDTLIKEGKCSLCGQKVHEKERFNSELKETKDKLEILEKSLEETNLKLNDFRSQLKNLRIYKENQANRKLLEELIKEKKKQVEEMNKSIDILNDKIQRNKNEIQSILKKYQIENIKEFERFESELKEKVQRQKDIINSLLKEESELKEKLGVQKATLSQLETDLKRLVEALEKKKKLMQRYEYLIDLENWIRDQFPILIRDIEREILASSALQFNEYFKEWFQILVEDENVDVEIQLDDFEPIIMVNGYNSPFRDLSGGERSALSLAYRLALNKIINERYQEVKTKDLLILDEPTDGFSQEQINKMQDIFEKLNTTQMIIISHERNLDSFVTDIFNFKKERHETKVKREVV